MGVVLHLNRLESPSPKNGFTKFGYNWLSGSGKEEEMWKVYNNVDNDDDGQSNKL